MILFACSKHPGVHGRGVAGTGARAAGNAAAAAAAAERAGQPACEPRARAAVARAQSLVARGGWRHFLRLVPGAAAAATVGAARRHAAVSHHAPLPVRQNRDLVNARD